MSKNFRQPNQNESGARVSRVHRASVYKNTPKILQVHTAQAVYCEFGDFRLGFVRPYQSDESKNPNRKRVRESAARGIFVQSVPRISMRTNSAARRSIPPEAVCEPKRTENLQKNKLKRKFAQCTKSICRRMCAGFEVVPCTTKKIGTPL